MSALVTSPDHLGSLNRVLWNYRSLLDRVEFLLEAQLVFAGRRSDSGLVQIAGLMEETASALAHVEDQRRSVLSVDDRPPSLGQLCELVDEPWDQVFRDHHRWFANCVDRIGLSIEQNRSTMASAMEAIAQLADGLAGTPSAQTYDRRGRQNRGSGRSVLYTGQA